MKKGISKKVTASRPPQGRMVSLEKINEIADFCWGKHPVKKTRTMAEIVDLIQEERGRVRSLIKVGKFKHSTNSTEISNSDKLAIVLEEMGEVAQEVHEIEINGDRSGKRYQKLRRELVQLAGTVIAWLQTPGL